MEEGTPISKFHTWEELGWQGVAAFMRALVQADYQHARSIRLWKAKCEDEGVREICKYLHIAKYMGVIELLDCKISPLGCEFLGKAFHPSNNINAVSILKLDHNPFGS